MAVILNDIFKRVDLFDMVLDNTGKYLKLVSIKKS